MYVKLSGQWAYACPPRHLYKIFRQNELLIIFPFPIFLRGESEERRREKKTYRVPFYLNGILWINKFRCVWFSTFRPHSLSKVSFYYFYFILTKLIQDLVILFLHYGLLTRNTHTHTHKHSHKEKKKNYSNSEVGNSGWCIFVSFFPVFSNTLFSFAFHDAMGLEKVKKKEKVKKVSKKKKREKKSQPRA